MKPKKLEAIGFGACADFLGKEYFKKHDPICSYEQIEGGLIHFYVYVPDSHVWASSFLDAKGHVVLVEGAKPSDFNVSADNDEAERCAKLKTLLQTGFAACIDEIGTDALSATMPTYIFCEAGDCVVCQVDLWPSMPDFGPESVYLRVLDRAPAMRRAFVAVETGAVIFSDGYGEVPVE